MMTDKDIEQMIEDCRFATSPEQEQRVLANTCAEMTKQAPPVSRRSAMVKTGLKLSVVAALALLILAAFFLRENRDAALWAEVQKKVAEQEWVHVSGKDNDETFESWSSMPLKIYAFRKHRDYIRFEDYNTGIREWYDAKQEAITRSLLGRRNDWKRHQAWEEMLQTIASGDGAVKSPEPAVEIVSQVRREIERDGKRWIEFEMKTREPEEDESARMTFLIEPDTHLIRSMTVSSGEERMTAAFSYPKTGPRSIHDLGVPKAAKVIDLIPSDELLALINGVRSSVEKFGPYISLNVMQDADARWYVGTPQKVWADGKQIRMEYGIVDSTKKAFQKPEPNADENQWWFKRWEQLWHIVVQVSDGKKGYKNNAYPEDWGTTEKPHPVTWDPKNFPDPKWKSYNLDDWPVAVAGSPLFYAYSPNTRQRGRGNTKPTLDATPENGPQGTVLLAYTTENDNPEFTSTERFWIDPKRSHIVMKYELIHGPLPGSDRFVVTIKELEKSPRGIWYPTLVSHKNLTEKDGQTTETETITRHYLDFETEFPEGVFEPKKLLENQ